MLKRSPVVLLFLGILLAAGVVSLPHPGWAENSSSASGGNYYIFQISPRNSGGNLGEEKKLPALSPAIQARENAPKAREGWARPAPVGAEARVALIVTAGPEEDRLLEVTTAWAERGEIYLTQALPSDKPSQKAPVPRRVETVRFPAGTEGVFRMDGTPGLSLLLKGLRRPLQDHQIFPLLLRFEKGGVVRVLVTVRNEAPAP